MSSTRKTNNFTWENEGDTWELFNDEGALVATVEPEPDKAPGWWQMRRPNGNMMTAMRLDAARTAAEKHL